MQFYHYIVLAVLAGIMTYWGRILFLRRTEYYRLRTLLQTAFKDVIQNLAKIERHPAAFVQDNQIDTLVSDILRVMPCWRCYGFKRAWKEYRYDKNIKIHDMEPVEYTQKSPNEARKLITERIHNLISKL